MATYGYYRLVAAVPRIRVADVPGNVDVLVNAAHDAADLGAHAVLFPEMSFTGYSCGDLFFQPTLQRAVFSGLKTFAESAADLSCVFITTIPLVVQDGLYNVAVVVQGGQVLGLVPKSVLPNYREFYERRQFHTYAGTRVPQHIFTIRPPAKETQLSCRPLFVPVQASPWVVASDVLDP